MDGGDAQEMNLYSAARDVLKDAVVANGLVCGLHQCTKVLEAREALVCFLADNCDEQNYVKLVEALCQEHSIPLVKLEDNKKLGEMAGLCKLDRDGHPRKVVSCSCAVVKAVNQDSTGWDYLQKHLFTQTAA